MLLKRPASESHETDVPRSVFRDRCSEALEPPEAKAEPAPNDLPPMTRLTNKAVGMAETCRWRQLFAQKCSNFFRKVYFLFLVMSCRHSIFLLISYLAVSVPKAEVLKYLPIIMRKSVSLFILSIFVSYILKPCDWILVHL